MNREILKLATRFEKEAQLFEEPLHAQKGLAYEAELMGLSVQVRAFFMERLEEEKQRFKDSLAEYNKWKGLIDEHIAAGRHEKAEEFSDILSYYESDVKAIKRRIGGLEQMLSRS